MMMYVTVFRSSDGINQ